MVRFFVPGLPRPRGSKRAIVNRHTGKPALIDMGKGSGDWMAIIRRFASDAYQGEPRRGPMAVTFAFVMPRPKAHYRTGKRSAELRPDAPVWCDKKPDDDKLARAAQDALKGVLFVDDCQVAKKVISKTYGERPGVHVEVMAIGPEMAEGQGGAA